MKYSYNVLNRAIKINFSKSSSLKFSNCDLLVHPKELNKFGLFDKNFMDEIFEIGYNATKKKLAESKNLKHLLLST
jgi:NTE family protein